MATADDSSVDGIDPGTENSLNEMLENKLIKKVVPGLQNPLATTSRLPEIQEFLTPLKDPLDGPQGLKRPIVGESWSLNKYIRGDTTHQSTTSNSLRINGCLLAITLDPDAWVNLISKETYQLIKPMFLCDTPIPLPWKKGFEIITYGTGRVWIQRSPYEECTPMRVYVVQMAEPAIFGEPFFDIYKITLPPKLSTTPKPKILINNVETEAVFDTASSLSLLSGNMYQKIRQSCVLDDRNPISIVDALHNKMTCYGFVMVYVQLPRCLEGKWVKMHVIDMPPSAVIGLNYYADETGSETPNIPGIPYTLPPPAPN